MKTIVQMTVSCTLNDHFRLMELARKEVEMVKPEQEWESFYPGSPTEAVQILIRSAIATKLMPTNGVTLHQIGQKLDDLDIPL